MKQYLVGKVLIMDNAKFHHSQVIQTFLQQERIQYYYLPPYSTQLNPIDEVFSKIKNLYRRIRPRPKTLEEVKQNVEGILVDLKEHDFTPFFQHSREFLQIGYSRIPFL